MYSPNAQWVPGAAGLAAPFVTATLLSFKVIQRGSHIDFKVVFRLVLVLCNQYIYAFIFFFLLGSLWLFSIAWHCFGGWREENV